jgi:butyrate kinase
MNDEAILVINPGSTSTKLALFRGPGSVAEETAPAPAGAGALWDQFPGRLETVRAFLGRNGDIHLDAVVGRGGLIRPVPSGTILVNEALIEDARAGYQGEHPSNLGCALADAIAKERGIPAYIVDPVAVDEMSPLARYSGHPLLSRQCLSHALNIHAAARKACEKIGKALADTRWVVVHLGGGFSVVPLDGGHIVDTNNANSEGPFAPTRAGGLPTQGVIKLCFSGEYDRADLKRMTTREGGLVAYLGTDDALEVERRILEGDDSAREVYEAMAYQVAKEIGARAAVLEGRLDGVVLTGGLARSDVFCSWITDRVSFLGPVLKYPGAFEMEALALGALRVLRGEEEALPYPPPETK